MPEVAISDAFCLRIYYLQSSGARGLQAAQSGDSVNMSMHLPARDSAMLRTIAIASLALILANCAAENVPIKQSEITVAPPRDYKAGVLRHIRESFFDPFSLRDAQISDLMAFNRGGHGQVWFVCLRVNGKNRYGAYTGITESGYSFKGDNISHGGKDYAWYNCEYAVYQPFPEAEAIE